jgi:transcriptional regulator of heat shock response
MYADALLKVAREKADLAMYKKLLNVFTDSSIATLPRVNGFIDGINKIIQTKETSSMSELKALLSLLKQKKIGANYLLTDEQRRIVGLWESSIS